MPSLDQFFGFAEYLEHGYSQVRMELLWVVVNENLGPLIVALEKLVPYGGNIDQSDVRHTATSARLASSPPSSRRQVDQVQPALDPVQPSTATIQLLHHVAIMALFIRDQAAGLDFQGRHPLAQALQSV
jgi:hypothetical protein